MIVYLEGVDGSGKSTLATKIVKSLRRSAKRGINMPNIIENAQSFIPTHPARDGRLNKQELINRLVSMANDNQNLYIIDRGPISDILYRVFDEHKSILSLSETISLFNMIKNGVIIVYCNCGNSEFLMKARGDDNPVAIERHNELKRLYSMIMPMFNIIVYDLMYADTNLFISRILDKVNKLWN